MTNDRRRISIYNFTALLILYVLISAIVHLTITNSIPNFLAYGILIFPIHIIFCIVFVTRVEQFVIVREIHLWEHFFRSEARLQTEFAD